MKLLRTIALDPSDTFVFDPAAEPGEWAVSGAFRFWDSDPATLETKARSAFRSGFLGVQSWGWSTLVQIVEATEEDREEVIDLLAHQFVARMGAPDLAAARAAAEEEVAFAQSLCEYPPDTLIAVHRTATDGEIREAFRTLQRRGEPCHSRAFSFVEVDDGQEPVPGEGVDLKGLATERDRR